MVTSGHVTGLEKIQVTQWKISDSIEELYFKELSNKVNAKLKVYILRMVHLVSKFNILHLEYFNLSQSR